MNQRLVFSLLVLGLVAGCSGPSRNNPTLVYPRSPAEGKPTMCPVNITNPNPDGTPSPVQTQCAYEDTAGGGITQLGGKVYTEGAAGGLGTGAPDMVVTVHRVREPARKPGSGEQVARTTTDAQGSFHLSAILPPAQYDVVVRDPASGEVLTFRRIRLEGTDPRTLESLQLTLPAIP